MSTVFDAIREELAEINPEALLADGFEDALIGRAQQFNNHVALYDYDRCIEILVKRDEMTEAEAVEYFEFNVVGAWVGNGTPMFAVINKTKC